MYCSHYYMVFVGANCRNKATFYGPELAQIPLRLAILFLFYLSCLFMVLGQVAELVRKRAPPEAVFLVRLVLMLLASRIGTLILCGSACFSRNFPFLKKFHKISLEKREQILKKWSQERFLMPLRLVFLTLKIFCCLIFFSQVRSLSSM